MCDIDVGKCCDIDVQEQGIELLIRNHGGDVLWPQMFSFSRRQTCVAKKELGTCICQRCHVFRSHG